MNAEPIIFYFVHNAEVRDGGVLRIGTGGSDGDNFFDGYYEVAPEDPDYRFWLWLRQRQKPHWYQFGPVSGLDGETIAELREQYDPTRISC